MKTFLKVLYCLIGVLTLALICYGFVKAPLNNGNVVVAIKHINLATDKEYVENPYQARVTTYQNDKMLKIKLSETSDFPERQYTFKRTLVKDNKVSGRFYHSVDFDKDGVCAIYTEMFIMIIYDDDNFETHVILIY